MDARMPLLAALLALFALGIAIRSDDPVAGATPLAHGRRDVILCSLQALPQDMFTHVQPPLAFLRGIKPGGPGESSATITVNYTGFSAQAQAAFQYAVDIWQSQLTSSGPIVVDATFTVDGFGPDTLGSAAAGFVFRNFSGATKSNTWYAKALANKRAGGDVNAAFTPEINARFNSGFAWYLGTDGQTPAGQYDFVSVVLHELGHGLGFFGSASVSGGLGSIRRSGNPDIYDQFVENGSGQALLAAFTSGTSALAAQLQGDSLYWNGSNGVAAAGGTRPRLYAPSTWDSGSSYSHLNEATYPAGSANSLMTYALGSAEAIHDPGPIVRGMFSDEGWTTQVASPPVITTQPQSQAVASGQAASLSVVVTGTEPISYQWYSGVTGTTSNPVAGGTSSSYTTPALTSTASYWVRASNIAGSADSDTATLTVYAAFTDNVLTAGLTMVRAVHVTELRTRIDAIRTARGLAGYAWAWAPTAAITVIQAQHLLDLREALRQAYVAAGQTPPTYTDLGPGASIRAVHISELRSAVVALE